MPPISQSLASQILSSSDIPVAMPALSGTLYVSTGESLRGTSCVKTPELVPLRDSSVDTYDVPDNAGVATGISDEDRIRFAKLREIGGTAATHDDLKQTSGTLNFKQLVKNIDFETFKTLERENIERENIERENIELKELLIRLTTTRIDEQKTKIEERETIDDIPTRSEPISTSKCEKHESKVKSDPDMPPSDSSDDSLSSSDSRRKRKKIIRKIIRKRRRKQKYESDPSSSDDSDDSDSSDDGHKEHQKKDPIRLCANLTAKLLTTAFKSKMT